jgi:hypothetical protein
MDSNAAIRGRKTLDYDPRDSPTPQRRAKRRKDPRMFTPRRVLYIILLYFALFAAYNLVRPVEKSE